MKKIILILIACALNLAGYGQMKNADSTLKSLNFKKDSTLNALMHADSARVDKEFDDQIKLTKLLSGAIYPALKGGAKSGVIPVKDPTEIPDPTLDYKLLFELVEKNPDSLANEINSGLTEVARVINLHVASGVPLNKIFVVIVAHGPALNALTNNEYYKKHFKMDNPNLKLINDLAALGTKFIACGQAMAFMELKREALLPLVKVSLTAQTVLSSYGLKGYVKYK